MEDAMKRIVIALSEINSWTRAARHAPPAWAHRRIDRRRHTTMDDDHARAYAGRVQPVPPCRLTNEPLQESATRAAAPSLKQIRPDAVFPRILHRLVWKRM